MTGGSDRKDGLAFETHPGRIDGGRQRGSGPATMGDGAAESEVAEVAEVTPGSSESPPSSRCGDEASLSMASRA